ncbi:hypothetical protein GCM10022251_78920 [Phytohabitans flavus]|uniref:DUF7919 domain-containing protein n=1 Tax=Phytohabitans flavus TaxID=1076124 RepID=A0A6F8XLR6_9ACTN|nr:hypothetical protein [Phytohabitans flavus]BCB74762.1 hypothetical protein Pflav_011720 [Phytohabitans flavus]
MAFFEDLSAHQYRDMDVISFNWGWLSFRPRYDRINVGWLDAPHPFEQGPIPDGFAAALLDIIAGPRTNVMRGYHDCSFCPQRSMSSIPTADHATGTLVLGHSEIRVPSTRRDTMFAAPSLIVHYVTVHAYRPPSPFIAAVQQHDPNWTTEPSPWIPADAQRITLD